VIKPHGRLVPVSSRIAALTHLAYQRGSLPRAFRDLAVRQTQSWEALGA